MFFMTIDTKIMIQRATDFAKEASTIQKRGENAQNYLVQHANEKTELQKTRIDNLHRKDENTIHGEKEKNRQKDQEAGHDGKKAVKPANSEDPEVAPGNSIIDIRI